MNPGKLNNSERLNYYLNTVMYYDSDIGNNYNKSLTYAKNFNKLADKLSGSPNKMKNEIYGLLAKMYRFGRGTNTDAELSEKISQLAAKYGNHNE